MKSILLHTLFILSMLCGFGCAPAGDSPEQMVAAAKALDQRWLEVYNKKDVDGLMSLYWNSPELVSFPPGAMQIRGWENVKQSFVQEFTEMKGGKLELLESSNAAAGEVVLGTGKWRFTIPSPQGAPIEVMGRYTDVKAKRGGKWVFILDHASAPLPAPQGEPDGK